MDTFEDFVRTMTLLGDLAVYAHSLNVDHDFVAIVAPSLAASLPEPPPGLLPPYDGPKYPGGGW
ncbi:hypothetical protein [Streptomyces sp. NPDC016845]|uniref:hypothetical protein n=1 Tax=Streptomyces sp. NPDC016845 TaxID=3364972 RepID=UPI0037A01523